MGNGACILVGICGALCRAERECMCYSAHCGMFRIWLASLGCETAAMSHDFAFGCMIFTICRLIAHVVSNNSEFLTTVISTMRHRSGIANFSCCNPVVLSHHHASFRGRSLFVCQGKI